ncbi:MAG: ketopantoate reductase family protein [Gammaproteobacteria bacterium]
MRVLIVGAGATGTVFGAALLRGGAHVDYYVRPAHRERLARPLQLNHQGLLRLVPEQVSGFRVFCSPAELQGESWDQVWFTTPSDALRGPWLDEFLAAAGKATLVVLQPDPEDIAWIRAHGGKDHNIVQGLIQFSAWQSPLPHEPADREGITCLVPPVGPAAIFDAEPVESATIAATLRHGGLRASTRADLPAHAARMSALMIPLVAGLELADWNLDRYAGHEVLDLALAAAHEAIAAECARFSTGVPLGMRGLLNRPMSQLTLKALPWVPGFNAGEFLHYHFRKVDRQTRQMLGTYRRNAERHGLPHTALDRLLATLPPPTH